MKHRKLSPIVTASAAAALLALASGQTLAQSATTGGTTVGAVDFKSNWAPVTSGARLQSIDGSGLSQPYTSGVTMFDTWVASTTHNSNSSTTRLELRYTAGVSPMLSFDLGAEHDINGLAWFEASSRPAGTVTGIKVYADDDFDLSNGNTGLLLDTGTFAKPAGWTPGAALPNVFSFAQAAQTRYLNLELIYSGAIHNIAIGEVVFREASVSAVPEPGTYALMLAGLGAVGFMARRRRSA